MIRTGFSTITPELIILDYTPASLGARAGAFIVDFIMLILSITVLNLLIFLAMLSLGHLWLINDTLTLIITIAFSILGYFFVLWILPILIEVKTKGGSLGKLLFGIHVVKDNGNPIGWKEAAIRRASLLVEVIVGAQVGAPYLFGISILFTAIHPQGKRVGDLLAGTTVCKRPILAVTTTLLFRSFSVPHANPIAPPFALDTELQQTIIQFAQMAYQFTPEHARYLIEHIPDIAFAPEQPDSPQGVERIIGIANHLIGRGSVSS